MERTILISGASRGIGKAIAKRLLKEGHNISLGMRDLEAIKGTILDPELSGYKKILINKYDAKIEEDAKSWVENTIEKFQNIDTVINCAGIFNNTGLIYNPQDRVKIDELWNINVMGPWILTKSAWKHLSVNKSGRVIVLVSMSGQRSKGNLAGYTASKFALLGLCQTMRNEGWNSGIRVSAICPGWVNTDMAKNVKSINKEDMTQPEDIANIASKLLELPNTCVPFEIKINCNLEK